ncbi:MAG: conserved hypothetical secreted protein [Rhodoferax sp.]|nr:conserved hypothetical secreted protein [Rhodoferax sp.]
MSPPSLIDLLRQPAGAGAVRESEWNAIVTQATNAQMLGQLAAAIGRAGCAADVPQAVRVHLELALLTSLRRREAALWEVSAIRGAIDAATPLVVLKGCAYAACDDTNAAGRVFSDIDILVPRDKLDRAEGQLIGAGFNPGRTSAYDQRYYREWMHEVPPMQHMRRHTSVDLHHAINPPVSRVHVATAQLMPALREISPGVMVLGTADRVIHCAIHLVQEGDAQKLLRDLYDLHLLLQQHFADNASLATLWQRADELGVLRLVRPAQQAAARLFSANGSAAKPDGWLARSLVAAACWPRPDMSAPLAEALLLAHSHWIKMPLRLLVPHLLRKAWTGATTKADSEE